VWTNEEMLSGINEKIEISFPKKYMLESYNKANEAFSAGDLIKQFRDVNLLVKEERELSLIELEIQDLRKKGSVGDLIAQFLI
jgi:hypothetical protein